MVFQIRRVIAMPSRGGNSPDIRDDRYDAASAGIDDDKLVADDDVIVALIAAHDGCDLGWQLLQLHLRRYGGADGEREFGRWHAICGIARKIRRNLLALRIGQLERRRSLVAICAASPLALWPAPPVGDFSGRTASFFAVVL